MFYKARFNEINKEEIIIEKEELTEEKVKENKYGCPVSQSHFTSFRILIYQCACIYNC